ncbi:hypothetical protein KDI_04100 [Dictyobacter arantiisoli]|uniref:Mannosyl-glycoprotein endo-beta-N-acetylglucosamidase-like domain-containing protein n=2 Tax=Dictyobacter arantiisoli TaxID=2014874 RepID=A0A5A5T6N7_9CHLR|nr:hypothetical protein KDI_04100 [Dictyobacter arantiisoli]
MTGTGSIVEQASRATHIDDAFALAVWWAETNDGEAGVGRTDRNPGSVRGSTIYPGDYSGYTIYPSYAVAIPTWFQLLQNSYIGRGAVTVYGISSTYVGTSGADDWAYKVSSLMAQYRYAAPVTAPASTNSTIIPNPSPSPAPTPDPTPQLRSYVPLGHEQGWHQSGIEVQTHHHSGWLARTAPDSTTHQRIMTLPVTGIKLYEKGENKRTDITDHMNMIGNMTEKQWLERGSAGCFILAAVILLLLGSKRIRQLIKQRSKQAQTDSHSVRSIASLPEYPDYSEYHTITEALVAVPPTPILAHLGNVPLTPLLPILIEIGGREHR